MRLTYWHALNPKMYASLVFISCVFVRFHHDEISSCELSCARCQFFQIQFPHGVRSSKEKRYMNMYLAIRMKFSKANDVSLFSFLKSNIIRAFEMKNWNNRHSNLLKLHLSQTMNEQSKYSNSCRPFSFYSISSRFIHSVQEKSSLLYKYISFGLIF